MPFDLPAISPQDFRRSLSDLSPEPLSEAATAALHAHYLELARWNRKLSLIGPGTASEVLSRHYGESLEALPLIPPGARDLVDLGSGAGFPGLVLAAARPDLGVTLVEGRERKWSFLLSAARRASLPVRCLNVRVSVPLPAGFPEAFDLVTARALKLDPPVLAALARCLRPGGRILLWTGEQGPDLPRELAVADERRLAGSERRRILVLHSVPDESSP
jgi:16S rRNA (guanine527-N7)-methyltransferase